MVGQAGGRPQGPQSEFHNPHFLAPSHFELREDGSIGTPSTVSARRETPTQRAGTVPGAPPSTPPRLTFSDPSRGVWLYHGNCLELLDAIYARHGNAGRFDAIFADPPHFLSNGGITCHAGELKFMRSQLTLKA